MESSLYILPILILLIFAFALLRKFNAYDAFVSGAKEGLSLFVTLFPSLLAMMFAVSLLRESGLFTVMAQQLGKVFPGDSFGYLRAGLLPPDLRQRVAGNSRRYLETLGPDSLAGKMASVIQGSDTTLYVITLYFSSVGVKKIKIRCRSVCSRT